MQICVLIIISALSNSFRIEIFNFYKPNSIDANISFGFSIILAIFHYLFVVYRFVIWTKHRKNTLKFCSVLSSMCSFVA